MLKVMWAVYQCVNRSLKYRGKLHQQQTKQNEETSEKHERSCSQLTNKFECEDTMRHSPFDVILLGRCVVITCQQVYLQEDGTRGKKIHPINKTMHYQMFRNNSAWQKTLGEKNQNKEIAKTNHRNCAVIKGISCGHIFCFISVLLKA